MINTLDKRTKFILAIFLVIGLIAFFVCLRTNETIGRETAEAEPEPLYWVAPMDPNYRRDEPGLSPMGMELIPVYAEEGTGTMGPGTIAISPNLVNNLGVRTGQAEIGTLQSQITTVGYVTYDQDKLIHINPRVEGWIEKLHVNSSGDPVVQGQPLYEIYSPQIVSAQEELLMALNANNNQLIQAAEGRLRALNLGPEFINTLKVNRQVVQVVTFNAPQGGVIEELGVREGTFVRPGNKLMSIANLDQVWVEAEVYEQQAAQLESGLYAIVTVDYLPGRTWEGVVDYVYPVLDPKTRTLKVRMQFSNEDLSLKPNMYSQVTIHGKETAATLLVPRESVIRTGSQDRVVLSLGNGEFKSVEVLLGRSDNHSIEILEGISQGDTVVTSAQFLLDSESSKTSDFRRMEAPQSGTTSEAQMDHGQMNHGEMDHSQMDHGQMNHGEMDHSQMDHSQMNHDEMDHSQMDHSQMNHDEMDHSQMDHSQMNHDEMDHSQMDPSQMNHDEMDHSQMDHGQMGPDQMNTSE